MVEERPLSDVELDAALGEAFAVETSPEFIARVRRRVADEPSGVGRRAWFVAFATATFAIATAFAVVMWERTPGVPQRPVGAVASSVAASASSAPAQAAAIAVTDRPRARLSRRDVSRPSRAKTVERQVAVDAREVLIPGDEQQALRRLFERPPTTIVRFTKSVETTAVAGITIPPLTIDPLSLQVEEGEHQ